MYIYIYLHVVSTIFTCCRHLEWPKRMYCFSMRCRLMRGWHSAALFLTLLVVFACHLHEVYLYNLPSGKLTWQWKMDPLKMHSLLKMGIFHCYLSLPEGRCHFVRWRLSLGIAGGIATVDKIVWPTLSTWNCQTCLTHFYDSIRYFLVPTKKAGSLKSLHSQLVSCCISIFHHENTHPDALSINVYPDDPRFSMYGVFAIICLYLPTFTRKTTQNTCK